MSTRDMERLLGGYMTGTLSESEQSALMRAALEDQQLFDALANEEALRDALADPVFRARLRARLAPEQRRNLRWLWFLAPALTAGLALVFVLTRPDAQRPVEVALTSQPQQQEVIADKAAASPKVVAPASTRVPQPRALSGPANEAPARQPAAPSPPPSTPPPPMAVVEPAPPQPAPASGVVGGVVGGVPAVAVEKKTSADELRKATANEMDSLAAATLELQVERSINGRFESAELGALREGDRVRFRVRPAEAGTLVMVAGRGVVRSMLAEAGRTYYLPDVNGLPPGDEPVEVAISLNSPAEGGRANLFRARQQAASAPAAVAGAMRDSRREDSKDKEESAKPAAPVSQAALAPPPAPRVVRLRLEFRPR